MFSSRPVAVHMKTFSWHRDQHILSHHKSLMRNLESAPRGMPHSGLKYGSCVRSDTGEYISSEACLRTGLCNSGRCNSIQVFHLDDVHSERQLHRRREQHRQLLRLDLGPLLQTRYPPSIRHNIHKMNLDLFCQIESILLVE